LELSVVKSTLLTVSQATGLKLTVAEKSAFWPIFTEVEFGDKFSVQEQLPAPHVVFSHSTVLQSPGTLQLAVVVFTRTLPQYVVSVARSNVLVIVFGVVESANGVLKPGESSIWNW
jgi:hypothetical protein